MGSNQYGNIHCQTNAFHPVLQYKYRNFVVHSKYFKACFFNLQNDML